MKNHISPSVNLYWIKISSDLEIKSGNWSYIYSIPSHNLLKVNDKARSIVATLMKSKRDEVARINIVQAQVQELYFMFNLEYRLPLYQEGYHMDCQQSFNAQHILKPQMRWVKHNDLIHYNSHWTRKNRTVQFFKPDGPVLHVTSIIQISDVPVLKLDVPIFTG
jgi:hypothetical protein